jgi:phosphoribosylpyrophosphate synthetase
MINDLHSPNFEEFIDKHEITQVEQFKKEILNLHRQIEDTKKEVEAVMPKSGGKYRETTYGNLADMHAGNIGKKPNGNVAFFDMRWKGYSDHPEKMKTIHETEISSEEINKKELPYRFSHLFDDFVTEKTEAEIREIAPTLDLNQKPGMIIMNLETNYPSLFDNFADWLFNKEKKQTTLGSGDM